MINLTYDDKRLWELQREERAKLSWGPDIDDDFIALDKALKRRLEELEAEDGQA